MYYAGERRECTALEGGRSVYCAGDSGERIDGDWLHSWCRKFDFATGHFTKTAVPFAYCFSKAEYKLNAACIRDSSVHWAKEIWDIDINICAGCSDGSYAFHDGMVCATKESNDAGVELEVTKEPYTNPNGSTVGYGTDYAHIKRKVCIFSAHCTPSSIVWP